jgi:hypothetical protein
MSDRTDIAIRDVELVPIEEIKKRSKHLDSVKKELLAPTDYQHFRDKKTGQDRQFIKRSGWRQIAAAFNISDRIAHYERQDREDGSFVWRITVEAAFPNGRVCSGVGACDSREHPKSTQIEHDIYSIAHTRAKNRAISDLVSGGVLSAEEMPTTGVSEEPVEDFEAEFEEDTRDAQEEPVSPLEADMIRAGLDSTAISCYPEGNIYIVKATRYLADNWKAYNEFFSGKGFKYNRDTKRWERGE